MRIRGMFLLIALLLGFSVHATEPVPLADFAKHMQFKEVKISPDGEHLAATSIIDGKVVLSIIDLGKNTGLTLRPRDEDEVFAFWWVSSERIVYSVAEHVGNLEMPVSRGELFAVNVDGKRKEVLFGYRASDSGQGSTGSRIQKKQSEYASAWMLDDLRDDDDNALITVQRWNWSHVASAGGESLHAEVRRIDVRTGKNRTIATAPLANVRFLVDHNGEVRFATGRDNQQKQKVYYRKGDGKDWELVFDEAVTGNDVWPVMFNRSGKAVYFDCGGVCLWDVDKRTFKTLWRGDDSAVDGFGETFDGQDLFAIRSMPGRTAVTLLDKHAEEAKVLVDLMQQFPGEDVQFGNSTKDGSKTIVIVEGDRDPGSFYLYDAKTKKLRFLLARAPWIKPQTMAIMEPFSIKARDGLSLHGYLTRPPGEEETKSLPMVVFVHGGPHGIYDTWGYNPIVQMLASRGYAVLQVNYRGSGGYGLNFQQAGYREWGGKMQDDITDATQWAIKQGAADPKRICIFGGSFGGYAALQGAVREPDLYQCTIGYVGVYDLRLMKSRGDIPQSFSGEGYLDMALGTDESLIAQRSPINQIDRIKADVMLIVGGEDKRVPPVQGESMRNAMLKRGKKVEWLYQANEGHGFYDEANVEDLYQRILAFLDRNIGSRGKVDVGVVETSKEPAGN
ncbi:MAG TPA: S9 family peptidase [Dokdonella sp.]|uniref:alpha/beta hydrolase family protein n=1 Tax=Dokdonella sp. TaxID=2291710 RepID=UPI002D80B5E4|nr:S9 family peptidase [Dokdonella sp.]HET9032741.1 S9 family peptidase [Dokdonella sp.]